MKRLWVLAILVAMAVGCETMGGSAIGGLGGNNAAPYQGPPAASKLQIKNLGANAIQLTPGGQSVMVYWTNTSGMAELDACQQLLEGELANKGYAIVKSVSQADYILKCQLTYFDLLKNRPDSAELQNLVMSSAGATIGGAIGANNHNPWLGAGLGGLAGFLVSEAINNANAQLLYYCELSVQIQERIDFIGGEPSEPIKTYDKTTVDVKKTGPNGKTSKRSVEVTANNEYLQSPTETTSSVAHSGNNNTKVVSGTRAAKFQSNETLFQTAIQFPSKNIMGSLDSVEIYLSRAIAGNFGPASMP